ncbi:OmpA family protein [Synechococcus sp. Nb3U1]|uniref:OmpA family protein n=1 Tax=Synechococcus sp. Nb3U1 TaxID=1914529 RepID=UPI001F454F62|nr:OmpA family protein [Synechococcus sp. Nb3U1]MCF2969949.1 OmpA family protein [Synechococcus sp. Nb3U1]
MSRTPRQHSTSSLHFSLNLLSGILLLSSGILAGMVLPQQAQTQTQPDPGFSPPEPTLPTPQILATLSPPQPQANPPVVDPADRESFTDIEAEIREMRQQVIQLLMRIEELESRLQRLRSQAGEPERVTESSTTAEIATGEADADSTLPQPTPTPTATPTPTSFQVGTQTISLPGDLMFDFDKAEIRPEAASLLAQVAESLESMPEARIQVNGHTDNIGSLNYNLALSLRRANAVKDYLIKLLPEDNRISWTTSGFGPTAPVADNDTEAGRQQNRRVDLIIAP